jgi:EAL domain-containing protein (putative c-di-GMP-specific phosphodiesterase class I)
MKNSFISEVKSILDECNVPAKLIEIEITESIMIDSAETAFKHLDELKQLGLRIAIDDFGTGYSSLSYLNKLPADLLKVDKSFIDQMNATDSTRQYVAAIISIGHIMNMDVIAEGVEEEEQMETLRNIGCDFIQGLIWGRPLPPEEAEKLV